jgi:hypothetical protein
MAIECDSDNVAEFPKAVSSKFDDSHICENDPSEVIGRSELIERAFDHISDGLDTDSHPDSILSEGLCKPESAKPHEP